MAEVRNADTRERILDAAVPALIRDLTDFAQEVLPVA